MESEHADITVPTAKLTVVIGLDEHGNEVVSELWENLADPTEDVAMFTKLGMVGMASQSLTAQSFGLYRDGDG